MHKKTKIVCTIGPASESLETLVQLLQNGMNVARLNFSHGTHEEHGRRIDTIRKASQLTGIPVAIMLDTKGPEIRTGNLEGGSVQLEARAASGADYRNNHRALRSGSASAIKIS